MKATLLKYVPPLAVSLLLSTVFHSLAFSALVAVVAFGFAHFDFFEDRKDRAETIGGKVFAYVILAVLLGALLALLFGQHAALLGLAFNVFICAGWGCMFPRMMRRMWNSK